MTLAPSWCCSSLLALALTTATGCEIDMSLGELDDTSTGAAATGDGPGASSSGSSSDTTGMAEGTTFGGETTVDGETTDTGQNAACIPPPVVIFNIYANEETVTRPPFYTVVEADCVVQAVSYDDSRGTYTLECDEGGVPTPHELEVVRNPGGPLALPMEAGTPVHLQVAMDFPIDYGGFRYIVVRDAAGELILGYYGGGTLPDDAGVDLAAWFAPLEFALAFGDCEPVPYEDPGISFIQEPCPAARTPLAVGFQLGADEIHLIERNGGQLGPLSLFVTNARHLDPVGECDFPIDAFSFVAYREAR